MLPPRCLTPFSHALVLQSGLRYLLLTPRDDTLKLNYDHTMHYHPYTSHGTLSHDKRSRQETLTKINGTSLLKLLVTVCVLDSVGASSARQLSTDASSAQPTTIPGTLASHTRGTSCTLTLTLSHPHRSPLTSHLSPL